MRIEQAVLRLIVHQHEAEPARSVSCSLFQRFLIQRFT
jgi:hypothetical protein